MVRLQIHNPKAARKAPAVGRCGNCAAVSAAQSPVGTTLWRTNTKMDPAKGGSDPKLCNACGIWLKTKGFHRPKEQWKRAKSGTPIGKGEGEKIGRRHLVDTVSSSDEEEDREKGAGYVELAGAMDHLTDDDIVAASILSAMKSPYKKAHHMSILPFKPIDTIPASPTPSCESPAEYSPRTPRTPLWQIFESNEATEIVKQEVMV